MPTLNFATAIGGFDNLAITSFIASTGTKVQVLSDVAPGGSNNNLGGRRITDAVVTSTDSAANSMNIFQGLQASLVANMGTVTTTATTNATVVRTAGSFITDGYQPGDWVVLLNSSISGVAGVMAQLSAVAALTLTVNGVPSGWTAGTESASNMRVIRLFRRTGVAVPANAGNNTSTSGPTVASVQLVGASYDSTRDPLGIESGGVNSMLLGSMYQAVSALPAVVQVAVTSGLR